MDNLEQRRTARQTLLKGFGVEGQQALHQARILIIGAGGLGSPLLQQLAAAGVGNIVLIDDDTVDITNIHRQILFGVDDVGKPKVEVAARRAQELQPGISLTLHNFRLDETNAVEIIAGVDLVLDGSDSFATKYLVADTCEITSTPLVWGTVLRFHGDVALWHSGTNTPDRRGVGLRDLFPAQLSADAVPDCATAGVLGVTTSVVAGLMATQAIAWITGMDRSVGTVSSYDAIPPRLRTYKVPADPQRRLSTSLRDYGNRGCAVPKQQQPEVTELLREVEQGSAVLLDIREPGEVILKPWPKSYGARLLPLSSLEKLDYPDQLAAIRHALGSARRAVVACASGKRSAAFIARYLPALEEELANLDGGINAAF